MSVYHGIKVWTIRICVTSIIVWIYVMSKLKLDHSHTMGLNSSTPHPSTKFLIDTPKCKIPRTPIWPEFIKTRWKIRRNPDCRKNIDLAHLNDSDQLLRVSAMYSNSSCCLSEVFRFNKSDNRIKHSNCTRINDNIANVSAMEFLVVKCGDKRVNYLANIPMKPSVQSKVDAWKGVKSENLPLNILIFAFDTVSRSHAYRSIPKTMDLFKGMGFHDFLGFHSLFPSTLTNVMGLLMGLTRKSVREGCAPNWQSPFDPCPFIWKNFSLKDYVTMNIEDGAGAFQWGGQSGFHSAPTDYYVRPVFLASDFSDCTSSETIPQFMIRYTKRFALKFKTTPFFSLTWLNYPFHHDDYSLANTDKDLVELFESLQSIPGFLERTLVIFMSDHGARNSYSDSKRGIESHIERGLPPLFIRFPELLRTRYPQLNLDSVTQHNVNSLTTAYDLHHTFLHILAMEFYGGGNATFDPVRPDRTSLFTRIDSDTRTCESVHLPPEICLCNLKVETGSGNGSESLVNNKFLMLKIIGTLESGLNRIVQSSKYKHMCIQWAMLLHWISDVQMIQTTANHTHILVQFSADAENEHGVQAAAYQGQGIASFEAKVHLTHTNNSINSFDKCTLVGKISRVSHYGNQSSCVEFLTDEDKEMKEFCLCKKHVKTKRVV